MNKNLKQGLPLTALDLERLVLAAIFCDNDVYAELMDKLSESDFYDPNNQIIYRLIGEAYRDSADKKIDIFTIHEAWRVEYGNGGEERMNILRGIQLAANQAGYALQHADWLRDLSIKRRLQAECQEMLEKVASGEGVGVEYLAELEARLLAIHYSITPARVFDVTKVVDEVHQDIKDIADEKVSPFGLLTGFRKFDHIMGGFRAGKMIILAARPGVGKSALAANWANNIVMNKEEPTSVMFYSGEMLAKEITERLVFAQSRVSKDILKTPKKITKVDMAMIQKGVDEIKAIGEGRFILDTSPAMDVNELFVRAKRAKCKDNVGLIVIDYLQLMEDLSKKGSTRQEEAGSISAKLKQMALELEIPVLVISQFNRDIEKRDIEERKPQLSDLRETGRLEQDADTVLFIHRPDAVGTKVSETMTAGRPGGEVAQLIIAKNRGGQVGTVSLRFWKGCTRFEEVSEG